MHEQNTALSLNLSLVIFLLKNIDSKTFHDISRKLFATDLFLTFYAPTP